jgi:glycosyltransferase involved in cell wall biosynthesis
MCSFEVVHISTSFTGGAGIAARRLNKSLNSKNIQSTFITLSNRDFTPNLNELALARNFAQRTLGGLNSWLSKILFKQTYFTLFSCSSTKLMDCLTDYKVNGTIIHIHNWFNFLSLKDIEKILQLGYKIVFTMHDQRIFTGGCHYSLDCCNFKNSCNSCPKLPIVLNRIPHYNHHQLKKIFITYIGQLHFLSPSVWIKECSSQSSLLRHSNVYLAPNPHEILDLTQRVIKLRDEQQNDCLFIGVASYDKESPLKGAKYIIEIHNKLKISNAKVEIIFLSDFKSTEQAERNFWARIDYLLVLSIADNSPNVIHEAKMMGIPVIALSSGGITELINTEYDYLIDPSGKVTQIVFDLLNNLQGMNKTKNSTQIIADYQLAHGRNLANLISIYAKILDLRMS